MSMPNPIDRTRAARGGDFPAAGQRNAMALKRMQGPVRRRFALGRIAVAIGLALAGGMAVPAYAETFTIDAKIDRVTVYPDRALVRRAADQSIPAGEHALVFANLPASMDENSLQFNASAKEGGLQILHVSSEPEFQNASQSAGIANIATQIKELERQIVAMDDQIAIDNNQISFIKQYQSGHSAPVKDAPLLSSEAFVGLMSFTQDKLLGAMQTRRAHISEKDQLQARLELLRQRQEQAQGNANESRKVVVSVRLARPASIESLLSYVIDGAGWQPVYDARYDSGKGTLSLNYFGQVSQNTSEDWSGVNLTLSTARPVSGVLLPELEPWRVDVAAPPRPMPMPRAAMRSKSMAAPIMEEAADAASYDVAQVQTQTTNTTFQVPGKQTIKAGGQEQRVPLATLAEPATLSYELVPAEAEAVFATLKLRNSQDFPLLAGTVNAFFDNEFIAAAAIKTIFPKEDLELAMGVDQAISVKRQPLQRFTESTGLTGTGTRHTYEYVTEIRNNRKQPVELVLRDRFPVSGDEKIDVRRLEPSGENIALQGDGRYKQTLTLQAGETRKVALKFSVQYPKNLNVSGLP